MESHLIRIGIGIFSCNNNYAISTLSSIDSSSSRIFQDVHALNVRRWNIIDATYRETVNNVKRVIALSQRCTSTHTYFNFCIRRTFRCSNRNTRQLTLQCFCRTRNRNVFQLLCIDRCYRGNKVTFLGRSITGHNNFINYLGIFLKRYIDNVARDCLFNGSHSNIGKNKCFRIGWNLKTISTVKIGYCTNCGTLNYNRS